MKWIDVLERRFGAWTIPQLPLMIVSANAVIYALALTQPGFLSEMVLIPSRVAAGEYWRLITFLFVPPQMSFLFLVLWLLMLYQLARALEGEWGEFRFLVFYAVGALSTIIAAMICGRSLPNYPLNISLFLAFATLFPEYQFLIFFVIPVKAKYLAWLTWVLVVWTVLSGETLERASTAASLVNYFLFFGGTLFERLQLRWQVWKNRRKFRG